MIRFIYNGTNYDFRRPAMGNLDELSFQRVNRNSRGGDLILFRDPDWPKTEVLNLTFDFAEESEGRRLLNFVKETTGKEIQYRDHENRLWAGFIQNPDATLVQDGRATYTLNILFEGDQVV